MGKFFHHQKKRNSLPKNEAANVDSTILLAHKGHFVVYITDHKRFLRLVWN